MTNLPHRVFVYGTLKKGAPNCHWLTNVKNGAANYIGNATTKDQYPLVIASDYNIPFLIDCTGKGYNVRGEVYEVDEPMLGNLDILEDHPRWYVREKIKVRLENGSELLAWVYLLKKYKQALLDLHFFKEYSSAGDHGLQYCEREERDGTYNAQLDVQGE